ncbi:hypothetical protein EMIHUDRAFT_205707 [Emiliania huxleyi CCMP1516]|uniref:Uncharacterized protein n=2 Tax=Emiliania huxleyi TaxID=2903 RepID=A0A0D3JSW2_EMIH1|nr:hypothetical protein EMIHUDRAFT_205707 [Emiliania huxleyi CCMP1516]EOD26597.1 hypothetical protein EMIHUDRAFT_205707 [Emiliania huxleyi CCMP1516]|eukprot:XP_005779026.1 hypothetical protein EMIHUDRAFT_205707 [Emiliania huxleyi CCMP1516]
MTPQAATAEHRGDGVDRRNAHHERSARERSEREAGMRAFEPPPDEEGAVEHLSASVVLAAVEESGPNYLLPKAPEPVKSRRKRLMVDEAARQAGQVILETGTRVEIFAEDSGEEIGRRAEYYLARHRRRCACFLARRWTSAEKTASLWGPDSAKIARAS